MKPRSARLLVLVAVAACAIPALAHADGGPKIDSGVYVPFGLTLGGAFGDNRSGGVVVGGEASVAYLSTSSGFWGGLYGDAVYDGGIAGGRYSFGPEIGHSIFGLDGGLAIQKANGRTDVGYTARVVFTIGILAGYIRLAHFPNSETYVSHAELGVLLKFPLPLWTEPSHSHWRPPTPEPKRPTDEPKEPTEEPKPKEETPPPIVPVDPPT